MKLSFLVLPVSTLTISLFSASAAANCLSLSDGFGMCPVGPAQIASLQKESESCHSTAMTARGSQDCQSGQAALTSDHPLYSVFGITGVAGMLPDEVSRLLEDELGQIKNNLVDELARAEFEASVRGEEIDVAKMRNEYRRLKALSDASTLSNRNLKAEEDFRAFNNSEEMRVVRRAYGLNPNNLNEFIPSNAPSIKVYQPNTQNGLLSVDLANMDWDDVPETIRTTKGQTLGLRSKYVEDANRIYNAVAYELKQGKSLKDALNSQSVINLGVTDARKRRVAQAITVAGREAQIKRRGGSNSLVNLKPRVRTQGVDRKFKNPHRRLAVGLGVVGMGIGAAWGILQQGANNQAMCDQAYPYAETVYQAPAVSMPPDPRMFCKLKPVNANGPLPRKAAALAQLSPAEMAQILDSDLGSNSTCAYFVAQYNARLCNSSTTPTNSNGSSSTGVAP